MTADGIPPIPRQLLEEAESDLPPHAIVRRWGKYVTWHRENLGPTEAYRLPDWQRHINWEVQDVQLEQRQKLDVVKLPAPLSPKQLEDAVAAEQYDRGACTFGEWVKRGPVQHDATGFDHEFFAWRATQDKRSPRAWGLTSLDAFGEFQAASGRPCACVRCRHVLLVDQNRRVVGHRLLTPEEFEARNAPRGAPEAPEVAEDEPADSWRQGQSGPERPFTEGLGL